MKLSVVIPVYNAEGFIQKSYDSIINQNIEDFEIIYIDNNSSDKSASTILQLAHNDSRVKLFHQPKQGAASARNLGINMSKGAYIYVFDVDDEIYPNALITMIAVLDNNIIVEAVFGKMVKSYKSISETIKPNDESNALLIKDKPYWGLRWFSDLRTVVGPPAFLYRREVFSKIGLYNEAITNNEDTAFDIKLGMKCTVASLDMYVYLYFKHENSTIQTTKRQVPRAFMIWPRLVKEHLPFYQQHSVPIQFKTLLFAQIYQAMARQICYTIGLGKRYALKQQLLSEIKSINVPFSIRFYLGILVILPFELLRKIYGYHIVPAEIKKLKV